MTQEERDKRYAEKNRQMGIVRVIAWIPEERKFELQKITKMWRDEVKRRFNSK